MEMISVIIPTHDRCASLARLLRALASQSYPMHKLEVIVVANGCMDDTVDMLRNSDHPFTLVPLALQEANASKARQQGAGKAGGDQLIFLDDDIEPMPDMVSAFAASMHHRRMVIMGQLTMMPDGGKDHHRNLLLQWWEQKYQQMGMHGHRFRYDSLLSGCFSISASLFRECGGFDTCLGCREDYELGIRLMRAQAEFTYQPKAIGIHHDHTSRKGGYRRKRSEGYWDMFIGRKYPGYLAGTPLRTLLPRDLLMSLSFRWPLFFSLAVSVTEMRYACFARLKLRSGMVAAHQFLQDLAYIQGIKEAVGDLHRLKELYGLPNEHKVVLLGWTELMSMQDGDTIAGDEVVIRCGSWELCRVGPVFAAEPLRKRHLVQELFLFHRHRVVQAMALEQMNDSIFRYGGSERSVV